MKCPYCGQLTKSDTTVAAKVKLGGKRSGLFEFITSGGQPGVRVSAVRKKFYSKGNSPITIRTTIYAINLVIAPLRIVTKNGRLILYGPPSKERAYHLAGAARSQIERGQTQYRPEPTGLG